MLIPAKQLRPGYRIFDTASQRLATITFVSTSSDSFFAYFVDHSSGEILKRMDRLVPVVSLGGVG